MGRILRRLSNTVFHSIRTIWDSTLCRRLPVRGCAGIWGIVFPKDDCRNSLLAPPSSYGIPIITVLGNSDANPLSTPSFHLIIVRCCFPFVSCARAPIHESFFSLMSRPCVEPRVLREFSNLLLPLLRHWWYLNGHSRHHSHRANILVSLLDVVPPHTCLIVVRSPFASLVH
jgi:hypothetical protein